MQISGVSVSKDPVPPQGFAPGTSPRPSQSPFSSVQPAYSYLDGLATPLVRPAAGRPAAMLPLFVLCVSFCGTQQCIHPFAPAKFS